MSVNKLKIMFSNNYFHKLQKTEPDNFNIKAISEALNKVSNNVLNNFFLSLTKLNLTMSSSKNKSDNVRLINYIRV